MRDRAYFNVRDDSNFNIEILSDRTEGVVMSSLWA